MGNFTYQVFIAECWNICSLLNYVSLKKLVLPINLLRLFHSGVLPIAVMNSSGKDGLCRSLRSVFYDIFYPS